MFAASKSGKPASGVAPTTDPNFNNTVLLLETTGTNGQQNNTFLDSSTGAFTITRVGTPTQGTFTPFSQTGWSGYFDGTNTSFLSLIAGTTFDFGSANFTIEFWAYFNTNTATQQFSIGNSGDVLSLSRNTATTITFSVYADDGTGTFFNYSGTSTLLAPINTWNHIALVSVSSVYKLYVNGILYASTTGTVGYLVNGNGYAVGIGGYPRSTTGQTNGYVSNVRVVKGTAVYTAAFTPPTVPLTAVSGTSLLTLQSNYFKDNSSNNYTLTISGTPSIQAISPFAPAAAYSTATVGGSVYFNGTTDELVKSGVADTAPGNFTIEYWVYFNIAGTAIFQTPISTYTANNSIFHQTYLDTFYFYPPNNIVSPFVSFTFSQYQWYHIAAVRSGSTVTAYVNGVALTPTATDSSTLTLTAIGIGDLTGGINYPFNGYISNLRIVKSAVYTANFTPPTAPLTAITNTALLLSATNAGIYDATAKNNEITVGLAQASAPSKFSGGSIWLNGTTSYLTFIDSPVTRLGTGNFTIDGWVYLTTAAGAIKSIVSKGTSTTGWSVCISTGGQLNFIHSATTIGSSGVLAINTWYYFAVVRSGTAVGNVKLYLNGTLTYTSTVAITTDFNQTNTGYVGASRVGATLFPGYIDELRISRVARTISLPTAAFPTS
jgi:hypothetical protein